MNRLRLLFGLAISGILLASSSDVSAAERFGDIVVTPQSLVSGETYHGYREFRVTLENQSFRDTHRVTLTFPDRAFNYGNSISGISRTVSLAPLARVSVPFWQPPLPQDGDNRLRVEIDNDRPEVMGLSTSQHMSRSGSRYSGGGLPAVILVSRSINFEEISRAVGAQQAGLSAMLATGAPDSGGRRGMINTAWMPDPSASAPHWLELDFDPPAHANTLRLFHTIAAPSSGEIILTGTSGTNMARVSISPSSTTTPRSRSTIAEFKLPATPEPVKTVRLDFGSVYPGTISIDAVELVGPAGTGTSWASAARASSSATLSSMSSSGMPAEVRRMLRSEVPVAEWSEHWLSYTPYDAIAVSAMDLKAMPPAVQAALWRYTECGGNLLLMGGGDVPATWRLFSDNALEGGRRLSAGFGHCFVFDTETFNELKPSALKAIVDAISSSTRGWQSLPDENSANATFPVIADVRVPVQGIVVIMLAFVLVIGPVNLVVLSRMNRRTWLLWTIPAISVVTSLVVFAYSMLREGVTPDVRIDGLTFLDQPAHRAASMGTTAFYCPLTPSQGLFFTSDTEATPLVEMWNYGRGSQRDMDWTHSQHLERGWVSARVPAHFRLRKSEIRRERLQLDNSGGQMAVVNGLGASIRTLWLADHTGNIYSVTNIPAGQKAVLAVSTASPNVKERLDPHSLFERIGFSEQAGAFSFVTAPAYLAAGTYIAELETNPFLENGLGPKAKSARTKSVAIVYGVLDPPGMPALDQ